MVRANARWIGVFATALLAVVLFFVAGQACGRKPLNTTHDKSFWRAIAANKYQVPPGELGFVLAQELSGYLASPDPELRDDLAYSILTVWIVRQQQFSPEELVRLSEEWTANLRDGIGQRGTDSIFKRSFSALLLSSIAERELKTPFLGEVQYRKLLAATIDYLRDEKDLRGFDAAKGWVHSTAHTADLLAALAGNPLFTKQDQAAALNAIAQRLASASEVFTYGEQDRLANVVAVIASRSDFDLDGFKSWLADLDASDQAVWKDSPPKLQGLTRFQNDSYMLRAVVPQVLARESLGAQPAPAAVEVQKAVLKSLGRR
ncbi:MAG TPA: DUF2785 domain-containing protein [Candidatus Acidoferrum sp.]|nr:DUF2785 domain-containing protein [Candidatus Acidoferrum sp.]